VQKFVASNSHAALIVRFKTFKEYLKIFFWEIALQTSKFLHFEYNIEQYLLVCYF